MTGCLIIIVKEFLSIFRPQVIGLVCKVHYINEAKDTELLVCFHLSPLPVLWALGGKRLLNL